ncbi:hypothetical protein GCM10023198_50110 [Promicromonospora umidemergens]|uniref:CorA-like Mg2+ transporter protein n=1 Tax=Promicromonospora umidemergens TaxID=629679 RepID=A0ABP8Y1S2_9MICO
MAPARRAEACLVARAPSWVAADLWEGSAVSLTQSEQTKKISAWAAILFAPTLIGTIYGMNFDHMPELHWTFGYPLAIAGMLGLGGIFYWIFKRVGWL